MKKIINPTFFNTDNLDFYRKRIYQYINFYQFFVILKLLTKEEIKRDILRFYQMQKKDYKKIDDYIEEKIQIKCRNYRNVFPILIEHNFIDNRLNILKFKEKIENDDINFLYKNIFNTLFCKKLYDKLKYLNKNKKIIEVNEIINLFEKYKNEFKIKIYNDTSTYSYILSSINLFWKINNFFISVNNFSLCVEKIKTIGNYYINRKELTNRMNAIINKETIETTAENYSDLIFEIVTKEINIKINSKLRKTFDTTSKKANATVCLLLNVPVSKIDGILRSKNINDLNSGHAMYIAALKNQYNLPKNLFKLIYSKINKNISIYAFYESMQYFYGHYTSKEIRNLMVNLNDKKSFFLDLPNSIVKRNSKNSQFKNRTASEKKVQRNKAEVTGKKAEKTAYPEILSFIKALNRSDFVDEALITTSETNDDMGADVVYNDSHIKYYFEIKKISSFNSVQFRMSANEWKVALANQEFYYFVFVDDNWKTEFQKANELLINSEHKIDLMTVIHRDKTDKHINYEKIKKMIN